MISNFLLNRKEILNAAAISAKAYSPESELPAAYADPEGNVFEKKQYFDVNDTEGVIYYDVITETAYVAFRGTSSLGDIKTDMNIKTKEFYGTRAHRGFVNAYDDICMIVEDTIKAILDDRVYHAQKIIFTGHSLGGALANLALLHVYTKFRETLDAAGITLALLTYGSPKVFNAKNVSKAIEEMFSVRALRLTNADDLVPTLPKYSKFMKRVCGIEYIHLGQHYAIGTMDGDNIIKEHAIKRYIEALQ